MASHTHSSRWADADMVAAHAEALQRIVDYTNDCDLVAQFQQMIRTRRLGYEEARSQLYEHVLADTEEEAFAAAVVDQVAQLSGCGGWRYDW